MELSDVQESIINTPGNMIVSASAGTGKTHTMVAKIEKEISDNHTHKIIAAITFTIKAAKEIRDRITIDSGDHFIGTNNSFAIEEIIKPFAKDVYGDKCNVDMSTDYSIKKDTFKECLEYLEENGIIISYTNAKMNFVFELALKIVEESEACRLFLKAKYFKIFVDEYQDCDKTMHEFFMYLCKDLKIDLFVVGDDKQSIYIWRGAYPSAFKSLLRDPEFNSNKLRANYRSCQMIQNYSNLLNDDTHDQYKKDVGTNSIILLKTTSDKWKDDVLQCIDLKKETAVLRFGNDDAEKAAELLSTSTTEFTYIKKTPIAEITTGEAWLYDAVAQFCILEKYSIYDFMDEIPEESIGNRKIIGYVEKRLNSILVGLDEENDATILKAMDELASYFGYTCTEKNIRAMIKTITEEIYHPAFHLDELTHVAMTFHSSKGLEYDQVIVFAKDYPLNNPDSIYNHYVAVTRAKTKLVIVRISDINNRKEDAYCRNIRSIFKRANVKLTDVMTILNSEQLRRMEAERVCYDESPITLVKTIECPRCHYNQVVNLEDFICDESSDEKENGMGLDWIRYFDSNDLYECQKCNKTIRIEGWIREYPMGVWDSEEFHMETL